MELKTTILEKPKVEREMEEENEEEIKWLNHYSSLHQILLVGEGDFSFSLSLANAFGSAANMVSTSLDPHDTVLKKYSKAEWNLESLKKLGGTVLHKVDATKMKFHPDLNMRKFDRVVFNFPHAGFKGKEDNIQVISLHRKLVNGFLKNAIHMLRPYAEVHISHKMGDPFQKWNLEELASKNCLVLIERANFRIDDYPGYDNKRGDGARSDQPFPLGECSTFKFRIGDNRKRKKALEVQPGLACGSSYPPVGFLYDGIPRTLDCLPSIGIQNAYLKEHVGYRSIGPDLVRGIELPMRTGYQAQEYELSGNSRYFEKLYYQNFSRMAWPWLQNSFLMHDSRGGSHEAYMNSMPDRIVLGDPRHRDAHSQSVAQLACVRSLIPEREFGRGSYQAYLNCEEELGWRDRLTRMLRCGNFTDYRGR